MNDVALVVAGLITGLLVGLTGTGGGALMTPLLTLVFGVPPFAAVSSDLVTSAVAKPVAVAVHMREHVIQWRIVRWLCVGSVPAAFLGAVLDGALGSVASMDHVLRLVMGGALMLSVAATLTRMLVRSREPVDDAEENVSWIALVIAGAGVGLLVGITSVGSGSLMMVILLLTYPRLSPARLVGTDNAQAVPMVLSAALGQLLFGHVHFGLVGLLVLGEIPGVLIGARWSARAPARLVRVLLSLVLLASGLSLFGVPPVPMVIAVGTVALLATVGWLLRRPAPVLEEVHE